MNRREALVAGVAGIGTLTFPASALKAETCFEGFPKPYSDEEGNYISAFHRRLTVDRSTVAVGDILWTHIPTENKNGMRGNYVGPVTVVEITENSRIVVRTHSIPEKNYYVFDFIFANPEDMLEHETEMAKIEDNRHLFIASSIRKYYQ